MAIYNNNFGGRSAQRGNLELASFFDAIYSKFILGDIIAKVVPGALLVFGLSVFALSLEAVLFTMTTMSGWAWIFMLAVAWIMGYVVQLLGNVLITREAVHERIHAMAKMDVSNAYIPEIYERDELDYSGKYYPMWWVQMKQRFFDLATDLEVKAYERMNVVKDATGNTGMAIVISALILALNEAFTGIYHLDQGQYLYAAIFSGILVILLVWMNHRAAEEQFLFMAEVLKRKPERDRERALELDGLVGKKKKKASAATD